ncbi:hypothetical protein TRFO_42201 [Tritrichomonas foetus]|uniref:Myb-like DNA-binding domain containing protein n=1 Tax=Tritrichomonas foetus TaxID=1144522 RepID=A0A1J4KXK2_9EUKA|nr:hypothetical protein TRFO_42201 [Tritrichomonas foetus]|eukprot:OHT15906.1 hypothetical protein TRFO_42201 [Tritrichomonas foetus]
MNKEEPNGLPRRMFSQEEDQILADVVGSQGPKNWKRIASNLPGRNGRQCRDRWYNYLSPDVDFIPWTTADDKILVDKVNECGTHWSMIHACFPKRSVNNIKNRWHSFLKNYVGKDNDGFFYLKSPDSRVTKRHYLRKGNRLPDKSVKQGIINHYEKQNDKSFHKNAEKSTTSHNKENRESTDSGECVNSSFHKEELNSKSSMINHKTKSEATSNAKENSEKTKLILNDGDFINKDIVSQLYNASQDTVKQNSADRENVEFKDDNIIPIKSIDKNIVSFDAFWDQHLVGSEVPIVNLFAKSDEIDQLYSMLIF